jgi:hypothetical protein
MSFTYNGGRACNKAYRLIPLESMGVAFNNVVIPAGGSLHPCVSLYRGTNVSISFGPDFRYKPEGYYGLNTTVTEEERDSLQGTRSYFFY